MSVARAARNLLGLILAGLAGAPAAWAQAGAECRPGGSVAETNACAVRDYQQADADLQILYGDVMRALSAHERPALRQDHANWQRARITRCKEAQRTNEALPEWPRLYHECLTAQTQARRQALSHWLHHGQAPQP